MQRLYDIRSLTEDRDCCCGLWFGVFIQVIERMVCIWVDLLEIGRVSAWERDIVFIRTCYGGAITAYSDSLKRRGEDHGGKESVLLRKVSAAPGGGGGTQSGKGYQLRSDRWREVAVATRGAVLISYCRIGGLSESVQLIFHVK